MNKKFQMWSLLPFISRDISVWIPNNENGEDLKKIITENGTNLLVKEPYLVDSFAGKDGRISYAFRLVFQSYDRTLTDAEVNDIMTTITNKIKEKSGWQVR
jgi:phenylalanyl-tRNA synthetase beta subunit